MALCGQCGRTYRGECCDDVWGSTPPAPPRRPPALPNPVRPDAPSAGAWIARWLRRAADRLDPRPVVAPTITIHSGIGDPVALGKEIEAILLRYRRATGRD